MKKLFALFLVVAMLSVAGTAMATVTVSPDKVSVAAGSTATVTVTLSPDHAGTMSAPTANVDWISVAASGDSKVVYVATIKPTSSVSAGDKNVEFSSTEKTSDVAGHAGWTTTGKLTVTVNNASPKKIEYNQPTTGGEVKNVKVISITRAVVFTRNAFAAAVKAAKAKVDAIFTKAVEVKTAVVADLSKKLGGAVPENAEVRDDTNMTAYESANYTENSTSTQSVSVADANSDNLEKAAARLKLLTNDDTKRAIGVIPPFTVKAAGLQPMNLSVDKTFAGYEVGMNMGAYAITLASSVSTAAAPNGGNEVVFFNSKDVQVEKVPTDGQLTAIAYVEPNVAYEPILFVVVPAASADQFDKATGTTSKDVTVTDESGVDAGILDLLSKNLIAYDTTGTFRLTLLAFKNGEAPKMAQSGTIYTWDIGLRFPVKTGGWRLHADGKTYSGEFEASASGIAATTSTDATATIDVSDAALSVGTYTVTLGVIPASSDSDTEVFYTLGSVTKSSEDVGVGSSSGGCASMGSVLAVAVLGAFIAARKK